MNDFRIYAMLYLRVPSSDQARWLLFFFFVVFFLLTQWLSQLNVMTAGPKERAGFMLAPV